MLLTLFIERLLFQIHEVSMKKTEKKEELKANQKSIIREGTAIVRRTLVKKGRVLEENEDQKKLKVKVFVTNPAEVEVRLGRVQGLPNYSSDRIEVSVRMPCYREEVDNVMTQTLEYAREILERELDETDLNNID